MVTISMSMDTSMDMVMVTQDTVLLVRHKPTKIRQILCPMLSVWSMCLSNIYSWYANKVAPQVG
jgi:hypothetical protein